MKYSTQETLALLKILAMGNEQVDQGQVRPLRDVVKRLRSEGALLRELRAAEATGTSKRRVGDIARDVKRRLKKA